MSRIELMKRIYILYTILIAFLTIPTGAFAQKIRGVVTDSLTNEPLLYVTVQYEGKGSGSVTNGDGEYEVDNHARRGWTELTFSAIGYETKKVKITTGTRELTLKLKPADIQIAEVTVRPGREHYRRRDNPAVIFMRKVIDKKKGLKLEKKDFYEYRKYQKMRRLAVGPAGSIPPCFNHLIDQLLLRKPLRIFPCASSCQYCRKCVHTVPLHSFKTLFFCFRIT